MRREFNFRSVSARGVGGQSRAPLAVPPFQRRPSGRATRRHGAFTLLELLVVVGLVAVLSFGAMVGLAGGEKPAALQSAQALLVNLVTAARTKALATGRSARIVFQVDAGSASLPARYLRYVAVQTQSGAGWETFTAAYLPAGVYVVPGNFAALPAGLFAPGTTVPWTRADGSALRSTALRANQVSPESIEGAEVEQWVGITLSAQLGTVQSGDIVLAIGRPRPPGSFAPGESPVELENPELVRGVTLSSYAVPALINARTGF
jgi:prepilin-type N-terminal cleavage/methylation domain-containing protein